MTTVNPSPVAEHAEPVAWWCQSVYDECEPVLTNHKAEADARRESFPDRAVRPLVFGDTAPQAPQQAEYALRMLVAAGHISQAKADEAMALAAKHAPQQAELTDEQIRASIRPLCQTDAVCEMLVAGSIDEYRAVVAADRALRSSGMAHGPENGETLWLWKNGDHYLAYRHLYPCYSPGGDPMVLGEPAARAEFRESHDRASKPQVTGTGDKP